MPSLCVRSPCTNSCYGIYAILILSSSQTSTFTHGGLYRWRENSLPFFYISMGAKLQSQNRVDINYEKTVGLGPSIETSMDNLTDDPKSIR